MGFLKIMLILPKVCVCVCMCVMCVYVCIWCMCSSVCGMCSVDICRVCLCVYVVYVFECQCGGHSLVCVNTERPDNDFRYQSLG